MSLSWNQYPKDFEKLFKDLGAEGCKWNQIYSWNLMKVSKLKTENCKKSGIYEMNSTDCEDYYVELLKHATMTYWPK